MKFGVGDTVALTQCPVWVGDNPSEPTPMSGLFVLEEFVPYEPSAYHWEAGWYIVPENDTDHPAGIDLFFVSADELFKQTDPKGYGHNLMVEREDEDEYELAAERGEL